MFYSQYILAKRGPLGTIWIAAHLDRRLRKQQITETDIAEAVRESPVHRPSPEFFRLASQLKFIPLGRKGGFSRGRAGLESRGFRPRGTRGNARTVHAPSPTPSPSADRPARRPRPAQSPGTR